MTTAAAAVRVNQRCNPQPGATSGSNIVSSRCSILSQPVGNFSSFGQRPRSPSFVVSATSSKPLFLGMQRSQQEEKPWEFLPANGGAISQRSAALKDGKRPCRILCYGDSNTIGFNNGGMSYNPYGNSLAEALNKGGARCEIGICGLNARTAEELAGEMDDFFLSDGQGNTGKGLTRIIEEDGPIDLVILLLGTNDLGKGTDPQIIANEVAFIHTACHNLSVPTIALAPPTGHFRAGGSQARDLRRHVVDLLPWYLEGKEGLLAYFDAEDLVPRGPGNYWEPDEIHLSASGSQLLGRRLSEWLLPVLQAAQLEGGVPCEADESELYGNITASPLPSSARRARTVSPHSAMMPSASHRARTGSPHLADETVKALDRAVASSRRGQSASPPVAYRPVPMVAAGTLGTQGAVRIAESTPSSQNRMVREVLNMARERTATMVSAREAPTSWEAATMSLGQERPQSPLPEAGWQTARKDLGFVGTPSSPSLPPRVFSKSSIAVPASSSPIRQEEPEPSYFGVSPVVFAVGNAVEVWSNSQQAWCPGRVKKVVGSKVISEFTLLDKAPAKKVLHVTSREIRLL